jgi:two-component system, NtrC family, sensor kinase
VTLRSRLTLLFLLAVEVTFLAAVAAYWGLRSWHVVIDDLTILHAQERRLATVLGALGDDAAPPDTAARVRSALAGLRHDAQTVDESDRIAGLAAAVTRAGRPAARHALGRVARYYEHEHRRLRAEGESLARTSNALIAGIVGLVVASFLGFLAAIRWWFVEPVRTLERGAEIMSRGDLTHRIALGGDDELGRLAGAINHMAASLARIQTELVTSERFALLGELAAYVAHNIRNPLASIRASAQAEAIELGTDDPRRVALDDIVRAVDRLDAWVGDLLRSASPVALARRSASLSDLVVHCVELARPRLRAAGIELAMTVPATPPIAVDQAKLEQVVSAVLANATDASPRGGTIAIAVEDDPAGVTLRIEDQGHGVPPARRDRVFAPFASDKAAGTGLGLWLSQKIVVAHGGTISLRDREQGGTTVEIRLPRPKEPPCPAY